MFYPLLNNTFKFPYSYYNNKYYYNNILFDFKYVEPIFISRLSLDSNTNFQTNTDFSFNSFTSDLNTDDLVIIFVIITLFLEEHVDYSVIIALFLILLDQE